MLELIWTVPFIALLLSMAVLPVWKTHWWEKNYPFVCTVLALIIAARYLSIGRFGAILHSGHEYISFIALIGSLFVVAGGIHISVKGEATPMVNCIFLLIGGVLANILGTTGASMVLIRPWIRMNKYRITAFHVVFFIFIVSNIGGSLTPIGDPPLFLGCLRGIPFLWTLKNLWPEWLLLIFILLVVFFFIDSRNFKKAPLEVRERETSEETWRFSGKRNLFFLAAILGAVFIQKPVFLREALMILAAILSLRLTPRTVHEQNAFSFGPIIEVALLFLGIFVTMVPALEWIEHHAHTIGLEDPLHFFWGTGLLSSVLDNAPTYLNFLSAAMGLFIDPAHPSAVQASMLAAQHADFVRAISLGAVFFGAMTYIGNGPNFLVKSIAEKSKVKTPTFFGYVITYSVPILIPAFVLISILFF